MASLKIDYGSSFKSQSGNDIVKYRIRNEIGKPLLVMSKDSFIFKRISDRASSCLISADKLFEESINRLVGLIAERFPEMVVHSPIKLKDPGEYLCYPYLSPYAQYWTADDHKTDESILAQCNTSGSVILRVTSLNIVNDKDLYIDLSLYQSKLSPVQPSKIDFDKFESDF